MAVILKSQQAAVVDALRAARNADDELSRLKENSLEAQRFALEALVESADWKHGPATLVATFPHHLLCKSSKGDLVQVEWSKTENGYQFGRAVVHQVSAPIADLGAEVMETARSAVDSILDDQVESAEPMIATIASALDAGGELQRSVNNEINIRSLSRDAWWHHVVDDKDFSDRIPVPQTEGEDAFLRSTSDLLNLLKSEAKIAAESIRALDQLDVEADVSALAGDIAEDIERAVFALLNISNKNTEEALKVYEAVASTTPRLLNGVEFLMDLTSQSTSK